MNTNPNKKIYAITLSEDGYECRVIEHAYNLLEAIARLSFTFNADLIVKIEILKEHPSIN